jgi:hypothetical protein
MTNNQGYEYVVARFEIPNSIDAAEQITVELNRIAKYGWRLIGAPAQGQALGIREWTATFERPKEWLSVE